MDYIHSSHCFSGPTLSWDAMLAITKVELELILDAGMYLCFEVWETEFLILLIDIDVVSYTSHCVLEFNQSQWLKTYVEFNTQKRIEAEKMETKMEKCFTN